MATQSPTATDLTGPRALARRPRGRVERRGDAIFRGAMLTCGLAVLAVLGLMLVRTTATAWPALTGHGFVTGQEWQPSRNAFGTLSFAYGTVVTAVLALVVALPVSIGVALALSELVPRRLRMPLTYTVDLLAAVPSVVYGLWGVLVLVPWLGDHGWPAVAAALGHLGPFGGDITGRSYATAALLLAIMTVPIVTAITREVIATVPTAHREAAIALGATRWEVIRLAVLPHARPGIIGATMLGLGRALGETVAVALVIGASPHIATTVFQPGYTMASVIANEFPEATGAHVNALVGIGVLLFGITLVVNVLARVLVWHTSRTARRMA